MHAKVEINIIESLMLFLLSYPIGWVAILYCYNNVIKQLSVPSETYFLVGNVKLDSIGAIVPLVIAIIATFCLVMIYFFSKHSFLSIRKYLFALLWPTIIGFLLSLPSLVSILREGEGKLNWCMITQGYFSALVGFLIICLGMEIISYLRVCPRAFLQNSEKKITLTGKSCLASILMSYSIAIFSVFLIDCISVCVWFLAGLRKTFILGGSGIKDGIFLSGLYATIFVALFVVLSTIYNILKSPTLRTP